MSTLNHEWKQHEQTRDYVSRLKTAIVEAQENWAGGLYTHATADGTLQKNSEMIGFIMGLRQAIELIEENQ